MPAIMKDRFPETEDERKAVKDTAEKSQIKISSVQSALDALDAAAFGIEATAEELAEKKYKEFVGSYEIGLSASLNDELGSELDNLLRAREINYTRKTPIFAKVLRLRSQKAAVSRSLASHDALAMREAARIGLKPKKLLKRLLDGRLSINKLAADFKSWYAENHPELAEKRSDKRNVTITKDTVKILAKLRGKHHRRIVRYHRDRRSNVLLTIDITDPAKPVTVHLKAAPATSSDAGEQAGVRRPPRPKVSRPVVRSSSPQPARKRNRW